MRPSAHSGARLPAGYSRPVSGARNARWIEAEQDAGNNTYYTVGEPYPPETGKTRVDEPHPSRAQIAKIREVFVDCDISKSIPGTDAAKTQDARDKIDVALEAVASGLFNKAVPGIIADSGNGGHSHIILPEVLDATPETIEKAERAGKGLQNYFQKRLGPDIVKADSTWEVCRLARIPGTVNFPNATKVKEGRVVVASKLLQPMMDRTATLDEILADFPMAQGSGGRSPGVWLVGLAARPRGRGVIKEIDLDVLAVLGGQYAQLPEELRKKFDEALKTDEVLDDLWKNGGFGDGSGSDQVYALAKRLISREGQGVLDHGFRALAWVWDHADGGKGLTRPMDQGNGDPRSLARCWAKALEELAERVFGDVDADNDPEVADAAKAAHEQAEARKAKMKAEEQVARTAESKVDPEDLWAAKPVPMLPSGLLPGPLDSFATEFGKALGADPGGIALGMLATCATAIRDTIQIEVTPTWSEAARIWGLVVGPPSTKKTPIIDAATRPLRVINKELNRAYAQEWAQWDALSKEDKKLVPEPRRKSILINDATMEGVQEVLKASHDGIISVRDEMSGWFASMEQYANSTSANAIRAFWLQGYNGGPYNIDRVDKRRTGHIPNLSISLFGGIQPEAARRVIDASRRAMLSSSTLARLVLLSRVSPLVSSTPISTWRASPIAEMTPP